MPIVRAFIKKTESFDSLLSTGQYWQFVADLLMENIAILQALQQVGVRLFSRLLDTDEYRQFVDYPASDE